MHTAAGLRFLRTLAKRGERVPAYLLPSDPDTKGAAHHNHGPATPHPTQVAHSRVLPR